MKVTPKKIVLSWLYAANERILESGHRMIEAVYIQQYMSSNSGAFYIMVNMEGGKQKTHMKVSPNILKWITTTEMNSDFCNIRNWKIISLNKPEIIPETTKAKPIFNLINQ